MWPFPKRFKDVDLPKLKEMLVDKQLPDIVCANYFGVTLGVIKYAKKKLVEKGLVEKKRKFVRTLTRADAEEIRRLRAEGERPRNLASKFGVSKCHITNVCKGRVWK